MNEFLKTCLRDLEDRIDPAVERQYRRQWVDFLEDRCPDDLFIPQARPLNPPGVDWPDVNINDAIEDYDLMLFSQFGMVSDQLNGGTGCLNVRCNYGTGILSSLFGCDLFIMPRETNTLPTTRPLRSTEKVREAVGNGIPAVDQALGEKVFRCAERFLDVFEKYPKIAEHVDLYHPDWQGPVDVVELLWGSEMFLAFHDSPDLMRKALDLSTETYRAFARRWFDLVPPKSKYTTHWGSAFRGRLMIRNDSLMNLSPEIYVEFIRDRDQYLFDEFGGQGAIHYCGRGDHFIEPMSQMQGLTAINLTQPEHNDMDKICRHTVDKGIKLVGLRSDAVTGLDRPMHGQVHVPPPKGDRRFRAWAGQSRIEDLSGRDEPARDQRRMPFSAKGPITGFGWRIDDGASDNM